MRPLLLVIVITSLVAEPSRRKDELQYYRQEFEARYKYPIYDTLFEKIVWERKVSHLTMEFHSSRAGAKDSNEYRVTLLMMDEYPWNYKGQNYPIHFAYKTFAEAAAKFEYLNNFLRNSGVMAVGIEGKKIVKERILVQPVGNAAPRPDLSAPLGKKDTDPILTREPLPRRLPLRLTGAHP
ncbi:MAG: hypothetical protein JSR44_13985 [Spirochaetes bacterium]|nr:hypothetical protein [Spirochaetota bacterium]